MGLRTRKMRAAVSGLTLAMAAALAVAPGAGVGGAWAQTGPAPGPCHRGGGLLTPEDRETIRAVMFDRLKERIGLTDQQAGEIRATLGAHREATRQDRRALCEARVELRTLMASPDADPGAMRAAADRVKAAQARLLDRRIDVSLELRAKLTPEQWAKWIELRRNAGPRWHRGMRPAAT